MTADDSGFKERLWGLRFKHGWSQETLARRTGLVPAAISHFETGQRKPSFHNLIKLADALYCTTDYLLGRDDSPGVDEALVRRISRLSSADWKLVEQLVERLALNPREASD